MTSMSYKIAICEDDDTYSIYIQRLVTELFEGTLEFYKYTSGESLLRDSWVMHDVVFMDIQLGGMDGTEAARILRETNKNAVLVFCSGMVNPTPESIKMTPYRYLLKQYDDTTMRREIAEILDKMMRSYKDEYILVKNEDGMSRIYINDIVYISKRKRGSKVHLREPGKYGPDSCFVSDLHVTALHMQLGKYGFEFAHNSYLVNCRWVVRFEKTFLVLEGGSELNVSRSKYHDFRKSFIKFWDKYGGES